MNRIAENRWNDHKGPEVRAIIDRADAEIPALVNGLMADTWDGGDPWGSNLEAWNALEYACQAMGWPTHETFRSPYTDGDPDSGLLYEMFVEEMRAGRITQEDAEATRVVLNRCYDEFEALGLDY